MPNPTIVIPEGGALGIRHHIQPESAQECDKYVWLIYPTVPGTYGLYDPATQRVVDEDKIAQLRMNFLLDFDDGRKRELETNTNTVKILFDQAGLGKEPQ